MVPKLCATANSQWDILSILFFLAPSAPILVCMIHDGGAQKAIAKDCCGHYGKTMELLPCGKVGKECEEVKACMCVQCICTKISVALINVVYWCICLATEMFD